MIFSTAKSRSIRDAKIQELKTAADEMIADLRQRANITAQMEDPAEQYLSYGTLEKKAWSASAKLRGKVDDAYNEVYASNKSIFTCLGSSAAVIVGGLIVGGVSGYGTESFDSLAEYMMVGGAFSAIGGGGIISGLTERKWQKLKNMATTSLADSFVEFERMAQEFHQAKTPIPEKDPDAFVRSPFFGKAMHECRELKEVFDNIAIKRSILNPAPKKPVRKKNNSKGFEL